MPDLPDEVRCPSLVGPGGVRCRLGLAHEEDRHSHGMTTWTWVEADYVATRLMLDVLAARVSMLRQIVEARARRADPPLPPEPPRPAEPTHA